MTYQRFGFTRLLCAIIVIGFLHNATTVYARDAQSAIDELSQDKVAQSANTVETVNLVFSNDVSIDVELADEAHERQLGLMYRREMCEDCGMLFKFDRVQTGSIWMKNTYIPLDLAYINAFGKIVDIKALEPHDLTSVTSSVPVLYALEMNQGWFEKNSIKVGDKVKLPETVKPTSGLN
uniref:DUF192 domain-containing protein n=1 Tax=Ningiella ruwaisensis TaxID=2364274 RepID=UPI00109FF10D|nr:DUF192 domain-containing protein [Ningiella ruwaisensis]